MSERNFEIQGPVIGSNVGTSGRASTGNVHIGHIQDVAAVLRLLDELREDLNEAQAPTSTIEVVDDLRVEARKPRPSKDVTTHLMDKLADRGLGEQMKDLAKAFDALF
jgi:lysyl-tRNA synthetase class I